MPRYGLLGHPVGHSLSPRLFAALAPDSSYDLFDVAPPALDDWLNGPARSLDGFNVTAPHKEAVLRACDGVELDASLSGAVNCVRVARDGTRRGANTDEIGFALTLDESPRRAVVLGAGGAARAVCRALVRAGTPRIVVVNRDPARARRLVVDPRLRFGGRATLRTCAADALPFAFRGADLVVQATSAALAEPEAFADLPWNRTRPDCLAIDLVYRPRETAFLRGAAAAGRRTQDGLLMLAGQAVAAHAFFEGRALPADAAAKARALAATLD